MFVCLYEEQNSLTINWYIATRLEVNITFPLLQKDCFCGWLETGIDAICGWSLYRCNCILTRTFYLDRKSLILTTLYCIVLCRAAFTGASPRIHPHYFFWWSCCLYNYFTTRSRGSSRGLSSIPLPQSLTRLELTRAKVSHSYLEKYFVDGEDQHFSYGVDYQSLNDFGEEHTPREWIVVYFDQRDLIVNHQQSTE